MATWKVEPTWKKSIIERSYLHKGDNTVMIETGWRWGSFYVYTDDDTPPNLESGVDMYDCGYETEMIETSDGCWEEHDFDDCDEETQEWLEEYFDEGNNWLDLQEHEWIQGDCEMIIDCEMTITKINDDGSEGVVINTGEDAEADKVNESITLSPTAAWPFPNASEVEYAQFKCEDCEFSSDDINDLVDNPNDDDKGAFVCPECGGKVDLD